MDAVPLLLPTVPMLPKCDVQTTFSAKYSMQTAAEWPINMTDTWESQDCDIFLSTSHATQILDPVDILFESDDGTSPSDSCVYSPPEDELTTSHEPSALPGYVASPGPASDRLSQRQTAPITDYFSVMALQLLQACSIVDKGNPLSDDQIRNVIDVHNSFCTHDLIGSLYPNLDQWLANIAKGLPGLGLPLVWRGIQGAVNYLQALDADKFIHPIAARFALILFSLNYYELCKHPEKYCTRSNGRSGTSSVLDCILAAYTDNPRTSENPRSCRNRITGYYAKRGNWWWIIGATLGVGSWFVPDDLVKTMCSMRFTNGQLIALATLSRNTRPGTVRVFRSLEVVVNSIMMGEISNDFWQACSNKTLVGPSELASARKEDQEALALLQAGVRWVVDDAKRSGDQKMDEYLSLLRQT
ncbi:hypothetical protein BJX65DRAFT_56450 [Aspergillus insuetus]